MSRSGYYRQKKRKEVTETEPEESIINCFKKHHGNYGRIRIRMELQKQNIFASEHYIAKILKKNGLKAKSGRSGRKNRPKPTKEQYYEENLVKDKFAVNVANQLWCSDITELKCLRTRMYLCGVIDVATRRMVGWAIGRMQGQTLVQNAFLMAVGRNPDIPKNAVFHSDRGSQFTAKKTKELVEKHGFLKSMSRPGKPNDNQPIESFWHTLETELTDISQMSFEDASREIVKYIELYYNAERLHSGIGYNIPNEFLTVLCVHES